MKEERSEKREVEKEEERRNQIEKLFNERLEDMEDELLEEELDEKLEEVLEENKVLKRILELEEENVKMLKEDTKMVVDLMKKRYDLLTQITLRHKLLDRKKQVLKEVHRKWKKERKMKKGKKN